jgi:hypothetical protein
MHIDHFAIAERAGRFTGADAQLAGVQRIASPEADDET